MHKIIILIIALCSFNLWAQTDIRYGTQARPCCRYENGEWLIGGYNQAWWDKTYPGSWQRFGIGSAWDGKTSFTDIGEQPDTSGFERNVYTSPK